MLQLRDARQDDAAFLLELRNHPAIRAASFRNELIPWETHQAWLQQRLQAPDCQLFILEVTGRAAGQVRLDVDAENRQGELHIAIHPVFQGQGLGSAALRLAARDGAARFALKRILAHIQPDNTASIRAFAKAGFVENGRIHHHGHPCVEMVYHRDEES